ncbi:SIR2 family protein [Xanthobacter sp. TB0139]|uniref:SIR2 family protein n=1 Tax=Xanthobacter sp. TB0139 TaxID=3459178 RepID=UPI004039D0A1
MELEDLAKQCQGCAQKNPVIVLGSGASIPHGIRGMGDLANWLRENVQPADEAEVDAWTLVRTALAAGDHLEAALEGRALPASLVVKIVRSTWYFIAQDDYSLLKSAITENIDFPLRSLFAGLFRSTNRNIHVVTTNYDRVVEYAADTGGYIHNTGFLPGYVRRADGAENLIFKQGNNLARTVTVWKVHGSLDWFSDPHGGVMSLPMTSELPDGLVPLIVTPGVSKYQRTHDEPFRSAIQGADRVLNAAGAFICIGYGFRDSHIHPKLMTRCRVHDTPILVAARTLTPEAKDFLQNNAGRHYLALENHENGTMIYNFEHPSGVVIEGESYWELPALLELIGY